jgi:hypothetical protein
MAEMPSWSPRENMNAADKAKLREEELQKMRQAVAAALPENDKELIGLGGKPQINLNPFAPKSVEAPEAPHPESQEPTPKPIETVETDAPAAEQTEREPPDERPQLTRAAKLATLGVASDPAREALFDDIERQLRLKRRRREPGARRVTVTVSEEVFSSVSYLAYARDMDKVEVLTFLLQVHLPAAEIETIPNWLIKSDLETTKKQCHLSLFEDLNLKRSLAWLELRFELYKVDVIESIVQRYLPKAPFLIRPKRKLKAVEPSRTGTEMARTRASKR